MNGNTQERGQHRAATVHAVDVVIRIALKPGDQVDDVLAELDRRLGDWQVVPAAASPLEHLNGLHHLEAAPKRSGKEKHGHHKRT